MRSAIDHYKTLETKKHRNDFFDSCVELMDDELREKTISTIALQYTENDEMNFLENYSILHFIKFEEQFIVN